MQDTITAAINPADEKGSYLGIPEKQKQGTHAKCKCFAETASDSMLPIPQAANRAIGL